MTRSDVHRPVTFQHGPQGGGSASHPADTSLQVGVLGLLSLVVDGQNRNPSAPKPRQLLTSLILNSNRIVGASQCITELWGTRPPKTAMSTLQTYVLYIRQLPRSTPADRSHTLITHNQGYQLEVSPQASDRLRFEYLSRRGREASAAGDTARSSRLFGEALAVWRGPALADVPSGTISSAHVVELEEARKGVLAWRIEADLRLGGTGNSCPSWRRWPTGTRRTRTSRPSTCSRSTGPACARRRSACSSGCAAGWATPSASNRCRACAACTRPSTPATPALMTPAAYPTP